MGQVANTILASAKLTKRMSEALLKDVTPQQFARLANVGGVTVQSNHPAFVFGHLAIYYPKVLAALGQPAPSNPPMFEDLFSNGKPCADDPQGNKYPPMQAIITHFNNGYEAATAALAKASDAELAKPNPAEGRMKEMFPTVGEIINFHMGVHPMSHLGQVSAWRRMMGLGSAM
jgi:hypothetical protein